MSVSTEFTFRSQSYLRTLDARVVAVAPDGAVELDRTIFYGQSGGQPGDSGFLELADGSRIRIANAVHPGDRGRIAHLAADTDRLPQPGDTVTCHIDWERRHRLMRMHTALHLLSVVFPFPVTGGAIGEEKSRLDFDMPAIPDNLLDLQEALNRHIAQDHGVHEEWISDAELAAQPELVKTMKVKPPMGQGKVRLIRIGEGAQTVDLQPCGGTHVARTGEIGPVRIGKIQKKGKQNRRVYLHLAGETT